MKALLKKIARPAVTGVAGSYYGRFFSKKTDGALTIFLFHDVGEHPSEFNRTFGLYVKPSTFRAQLNFIRRNFQIISMDDLLSGPMGLSRPAMITFDDGLKSYFTHAVGILEEMEIPSTLFLNMAPIQGEMFFAGLVTFLCLKEKNFITYLRHRVPASEWREPFFLLCHRRIVEDYLKEFPLDREAAVRRFTGDFANGQDLKRIEGHPLVSFGNHLFNHDVARLLTDEEFKKAYQSNEECLKAYANYRPVFSFPFGQPGSCFMPRQVDLVRQWGASRSFFSSGHINKDIRQTMLDRICLEEFHSTPARIWYQIFRLFDFSW